MMLDPLYELVSNEAVEQQPSLFPFSLAKINFLSFSQGGSWFFLLFLSRFLVGLSIPLHLDS